MRKICFSDKYGLTDAVLEGRKTMTRRLAISDEDCLKEGICRCRNLWGYWGFVNGCIIFYAFDNIRKAFASLIDKVSGKGTWEKNPWVFVYTFILVK